MATSTRAKIFRKQCILSNKVCVQHPIQSRFYFDRGVISMFYIFNYHYRFLLFEVLHYLETKDDQKWCWEAVMVLCWPRNFWATSISSHISLLFANRNLFFDSCVVSFCWRMLNSERERMGEFGAARTPSVANSFHMQISI